MRPDEHKAKASRRWKAKNATVTTTRGGKSAGRGSGRGGGATRPPADRRGIGQDDDSHDKDPEELEYQRQQRAKFSRRTLTSNAFRYHEPSAEEQELMEQEDSVDRATEELKKLVVEADQATDPSQYFQFKDEKLGMDLQAAQGKTTQESNELFQIDFGALEKAMARIPLSVRLDLDGVVSGGGSVSQEEEEVVDEQVIPEGWKTEDELDWRRETILQKGQVPDLTTNEGPLFGDKHQEPESEHASLSSAASSTPPTSVPSSPSEQPINQKTCTAPSETSHISNAASNGNQPDDLDDIDALLNLDIPSPAPHAPSTTNPKPKIPTPPSSSPSTQAQQKPGNAEDLSWLDNLLS